MAWSKQKYRRSAGTFKRWSSATVKPSYKHNKGARTEAIRASILAEEKLGGLGATVQYRKHLRDGTPGLMDKRGNFVHPKKIPTQRLILTEYLHTKEEDKPPLVLLIEKRMNSTSFQDSMGLTTGVNSTTDRLVGWTHWYHWYVEKRKYYQLLCCFSGVKAFFVEKDVLKGTLRMSRVYHTTKARELANKPNPKERIYWVELERLSGTA